MIVYKNDEVITIDKNLEEKILENAKNYQLVKTRTITWEKLDEDRYGEDTDEFCYSLVEKDKCPIDFSFVVDDDDNFIGVKVYYHNVTSWNARLNEEKVLSGCSLYIDGTSKGNVTSHSSYDSPNNHDDVEISYSLKKISE